MYKKAEIIKKIIDNLKEGNQLNASIYKAGAKPGTVWLWRKANERLDRLIKAAQHRCDHKRNEMVVDSLFKQALNGNVGAIAFYLKNKAGWKDSVEHSGIGGVEQRIIIIRDGNKTQAVSGSVHLQQGQIPSDGVQLGDGEVNVRNTPSYDILRADTEQPGHSLS